MVEKWPLNLGRHLLEEVLTRCIAVSMNKAFTLKKSSIPDIHIEKNKIIKIHAINLNKTKNCFVYISIYILVLYISNLKSQTKNI